MLYIAGTFLKRWVDERQYQRAYERPQQQPEPQESPATFAWTQALGMEGELDVPTRVDMIERLAMLGEPWCIDALKRAAKEEKNPQVVYAIEHALPTAFH